METFDRGDSYQRDKPFDVYLWASANLSRSFSYFNCCSLCGPDSVDELFSDDEACFNISMFEAFVVILVCIGLSGLVFCMR